MTDDLWRRDEIDSPCVNICVMHPHARICTGCYRSAEEISGWSKMSPEERRTLMIDLPDRKVLLSKRRGGRRGRKARV